MDFVSTYVSHIPDKDGFVEYSAAEQAVWKHLVDRQMKNLPNRACDSYIEGLRRLDLSNELIAQLPDISKRLLALTGWQVAPVKALISAREFFELLAARYFPVATFIRRMEEIDYVQEPDIFHEIFGHCPLLTDPVYADFVQSYAERVLSFPMHEWPLLQRLFWFTVEFGLIEEDSGLRAYGGGILSSASETVYAVESDIPLRIQFSPLVALRTPYRIDMLQTTYFVIKNFSDLYNLVIQDLPDLLVRARKLGEFPPLFPVDKDNPSIHILAC